MQRYAEKVPYNDIIFKGEPQRHGTTDRNNMICKINPCPISMITTGIKKRV